MKNITLRQLRYVEALAHHAHFGRAAEASAVSQPALSVQVKDLEETLGQPLFERGARQVRLTPFGETWVAKAREVLRSVDDLDDLARAARGGGLQRLRLGVIPTIAPYLLPLLLRDLAHRRPGMDIAVRETVTPRLVEELGAGRLDMAILALPIGHDDLQETKLFEEPMLFVRPQDQAGSQVPSPDLLRSMRLLLLEEGHCFRDQALSFCNLQPGRRDGGLDGSSIGTLVQMVGAGLGVTLIPQMAAGVEGRAAPVAISPFGDPQPSRTVGAIWRKSSPLAAHLQDVADSAMRVAVDLPG